MGGTISELAVPLKRKPPAIRTDEDTVTLVRRLAVHYSDAQIAEILNRQGRRTAREPSFTACRVQGLRHYWGIDCHQPSSTEQEGELLTVADAAAERGLAPSALHRWLGDGLIAGEQLTPAHPGGSASPTTSVPSSSMTPPKAGLPCSRQPSPTASPARPCCSESNAASCAPSTSAPDAAKTYVSRAQQHKKACSDQRRLWSRSRRRPPS